MHEVFNDIKAKAQNIHILVVGDVMLDEYIWGNVSHISPEAPVPVVDISGTTYVLGGAANVANNLRQLGCKVSIMGKVGDDAAGKKMGLLLEEAGINDRGIIFSSKVTTKKTRIMAHNQQLLRMDLEDKETILRSRADAYIVHLNNIDPPDAIIFSDYDNGMYHAKLFYNLVDYANRHSIPLMVDPKGKNWERYYGATAITPNVEELSIAVGYDIPNYDRLKDAADAVYNLTKYQYLLVTQGKNGMSLFQTPWGDDIPPIATIPIKDPRTVYDVSGAGDTVMAVFALGLAMKQDPLATAELANLVAGIVVGKLGTATATVKEIEDRVSMVCQSSRKHNSKLMSYDDFMKWESLNQDKRTALISFCFDTLSDDVVNRINKLKLNGWVTFCSVESHFAGNLQPIEDRIKLAESIESVDFVLYPDNKFRELDSVGYGLFNEYIHIECTVKSLMEKMFA